VQQLGIADPEGALAVAQEFSDPGDGGQLLRVLFSRWAQQDPTAALTRWETLPAGPARAAALRALVESWSRRDPPAALAWARGREPGADRTAALEACLRELAARDPATAIAEAATLPAGHAQERVLQQAFAHLVRRQPDEAARLLPALPPGDAQTLIVSDVARALAERSAAAFAKGDYAESERLLREQLALQPRNFVIHYNLASVRGLQGDGPGAIACLLDAVDHGFTDIALAKRDPALEAARAQPDFAELVDRWPDVLLARLEANRSDPAQRSPAWIARQMGKIDATLDAMASGLGDKPFCCEGKYSLADIASGPRR
jgi:tetratricopeptide (TPR) repeat protein